MGEISQVKELKKSLRIYTTLLFIVNYVTVALDYSNTFLSYSLGSSLLGLLFLYIISVTIKVDNAIKLMLAALIVAFSVNCIAVVTDQKHTRLIELIIYTTTAVVILIRFAKSKYTNR